MRKSNTPPIHLNNLLKLFYGEAGKPKLKLLKWNPPNRPLEAQKTLHVNVHEKH